MWHNLETTLDVLYRLTRLVDAILHWRFHLCFLIGVLLGLLAYRRVPDPDLGLLVSVTLGVTGAVVGLVWDWRSGTFSE